MADSSSSSGTAALLGLLASSSAASPNPKEKLQTLITLDRGEELARYLNSLEKNEKIKLLSNSITRFGDNVPLRQAIHHRSFSCIRSLILAGAEVSLADGAQAILARNLLLFTKEEDSKLALVVLQSFHGALKELPFSSAPPPGTCIAMISRSHPSAWKLLPVLALKGLNPVITPDHDDMAILAQSAEDEDISPLKYVSMMAQTAEDVTATYPLPPPSPPHSLTPSASASSSTKKRIYNWMDAYYSNDHHHSLKNGCRKEIRKALRVPDSATVGQLRLPRPLKDYLLLDYPV